MYKSLEKQYKVKPLYLGYLSKKDLSIFYKVIDFYLHFFSCFHPIRLLCGIMPFLSSCGTSIVNFFLPLLCLEVNLFKDWPRGKSMEEDVGLI